MAFNKLHPSEGRPRGLKNAPKGKVRGKGPGKSGHPVKGKGAKNAPRGGAVRSGSKSNASNMAGRRGHAGVRSSSANNYGKAGNY